MNGRDIFRKYSLFLKFGIFLFSLFGKNINYFFWLIFRCLPGRIGILIRFFIVKNLTYKCGDNVVIFENVIIRNFSNLTIGDNVSIHPMCYIDASGGIVIQDNVSIAHSTLTGRYASVRGQLNLMVLTPKTLQLMTPMVYTAQCISGQVMCST